MPTIQETREKIPEIVEKIANNFDPEKIILFGSYAWGEPNQDSDVDFFIIKDTEDTRNDARKIGRFFFPRDIAMDFIIYTPEQTKKRIKINDFFVKDIINKGKVLYAK